MKTEPAIESRRPGLRLGYGAKVTALLVLLVGVAQLATLLVVHLATERSVQAQLAHELEVGERVWRRFHAARGEQLGDALAVLADDFGFREAVASGDAATIRSALDNHAARLGADMALLFDTQGRPLADSAGGGDLALAPLLLRAQREGVAHGVIPMGPGAAHLAVVPVLAPHHIAWVVAGSALSDAGASEFGALTGLQLSYVVGEQPRVVASTLGQPGREQLQADLMQGLMPAGSGDIERLAGLRLVPTGESAATPVHAVLQTSRAEAMAPFAQLRNRILALSGGAGLLAVLVAVVVGRGVTRPVAALANAVARVEQGDYSQRVPERGRDELGRLAGVFNRMQAHIAQREARIVHQANHDDLTGLPNRTSAMSALDQAIGAARGNGGHCALLMIDLDRFKEINDTLGHAFGDEVLIEAAKRLRGAVREEDLVARLGGDEFLVLMPGAGPDEARMRAMALGGRLREPLQLPSTAITLDASIGIAVHPEHGDGPEALLRRADIAMYEAKQGQAGVSLYVPGRDELHLRQLGLMADLRRSIERAELHVVFQPKVELRGQTVRHAEALLRWTHPRLGAVRPDEFVPLAERSGFVHELTLFVLDAALGQVRRWREEGLDLGVAVNLSALDLLDEGLAARVDASLARHAVPASSLILEVTESAIMRDVAYAVRMLGRLRERGVRIAIDDFGTGHSSLAQLRHLPVDELKIDRSFIQRLERGSEDAVIVRATIDLGHGMGLSVIAEGVEDDASLALLRELECDMVQGYLYSPPLPAAEFSAWCRSHAAGSGTRLA